MGSKTARLALLALAVEPSTKKSVVIAIGTTDDNPEQWRVSVIDPGQLKDYFDHENDKVKTLFDLPTSDSINSWLGNRDNEVGLSDGAGADVVKRVKDKSFWIDGIARIHFYRYEDEFLSGNGLPSPLAWLDTAPNVVDDADPNKPIPPAWAVSRLRIDLDSNWSSDCTSTNFPTTLAGFRFVGHVPIATNAHKIESQDDGWAKRYDTRLILVAHADRVKQNKALWFKESINKEKRGLGPQFKALTIGFSDADGVSYEDEKHASDQLANGGVIRTPKTGHPLS